jgi:hypothetical protein
MVLVMTLTGKISGLKAASLYAQYLEEYFALAAYLERIVAMLTLDHFSSPL